MTNEPKPVPPEDAVEALRGGGEAGVDLFKAEMTQVLTGVNASDAVIPSNAPTERSERQVEALEKQEEEEGEGFTTTDGYVIDEAGMLNNFAIEPKMYYEGEEPPAS